ncbi:hypothetical protein Pelo_12753 [Pelomyxa schiedti]|nr:hypothetical protein Pelo_12753 [Pelomyxa schiedti]
MSKFLFSAQTSSLYSMGVQPPSTFVAGAAGLCILGLGGALAFTPGGAASDPSGAPNFEGALFTDRSVTLVGLDFLRAAKVAAAMANVVRCKAVNLDLKENRDYGDAGGVLLMNALACNSTIEFLSLRSNRLSEPSVKHLCSVLAQNTSLRHLDLRGNTSVCSEKILSKLFMTCSLRTLDISAIVTPTEDVSSTLLMGLESLSGNTSLTSLIVRSNKLTAEGARHIVDALKAREHDAAPILSLDLSWNPIENAGAEHIVSLLGAGSSLTSLELEHCGIEEAGIRAICKRLRGDKRNSSRSLVRLVLSGNNVGIKGVNGLKKVFQTNTHLSEVIIGGVFGGGNLDTSGGTTQPTATVSTSEVECAHVLCKALSGNTSVVNLCYQRNNIGPSGAEPFSRLVQSNETLRRLNLHSTKLDRTGILNILQAPSLQYLDVSYNKDNDLSKFTSRVKLGNQLLWLSIKGTLSAAVIPRIKEAIPPSLQQLLVQFDDSKDEAEVVDLLNKVKENRAKVADRSGGHLIFKAKTLPDLQDHFSVVGWQFTRDCIVTFDGTVCQYDYVCDSLLICHLPEELPPTSTSTSTSSSSTKSSAPSISVTINGLNPIGAQTVPLQY